jgi:hypothetical protein
LTDTPGPERAATPRRQKPAQQATEQARKLLGELLQARRGELGYAHRTTFGTERGLHWRMVTDIEQAYRDTFTIGTLAKVADAYGVTLGSLRAVLEGRADRLEPVPGAGEAGSDRPAPPTSPRGNPLGVAITDEQLTRMRPYIADTETRLEVARAAHPGEELTGRMVFPNSPADADSWDRLAAGGRLPPEGIAWGVAAVRAWEAEPAERKGATGLTALDRG